MSYLTKNQLESYMNNLPSKSANKNKEEYDQIRSELVYPMQKMSVKSEEDVDDEAYGSIQDRMRRLRTATGTVLTTTQTMSPAFPETPKPLIPSKPTFTKNNFDAFEASLSPRAYKRQSVQPPPKPKSMSVSTPPPPPPPMTQNSPSTPPPTLPSSPRPPRPQQQDTMVKTLNPIYAGMDCPACHKPIDGTIVSAMDKVWHAHCFTCFSCHKPLENEQYFKKDGKPYCSRDYRDLFSLHCDFCHEPIEQHAINALGKYYHEGHFCCTACKTPFGDHSAFLVHEDKPYCQEDYMKLFGKKCAGCGEGISGEYVNALDQSWHKGCFACTDCKRPFANGTFLVRDNRPYCEEHYERPHPRQQEQRQQEQRQQEQRQPPVLKPKPSIPKKPELKSPTIENKPLRSTPRNDIKSGSAKLCHSCNEVIDGPSTNALGHDYHIHHFQCSRCNRALSSRVPGMWQGDERGEVICKVCAMKRE